MMKRTRARGRWPAGTSAPSSRSLVGPDLGVAALVAGDPVERPGADRILLDARERVVQDDRVAFELQVVEAALDIDRGHASMVVRLAAVRRVPDVLRVTGPRRLGDVMPTPPLRYLTAADVLAAMPPIEERLELAERTMVALGPRRRAAGEDRRASRGRTDRSRTRCRRTCADPRATASRRPARDQVGRRLPGQRGARAAGDPRGRGHERSVDRPAGRDPRRRADHRAADGRGLRGRDRAIRPAPARPARRSSGPASRATATCRSSGTSSPGVRLAIHDRQPDRAEALAAEARDDAGHRRGRGGRHGSRRRRRRRRRGHRRVLRATGRAPGDDRTTG